MNYNCLSPESIFLSKPLDQPGIHELSRKLVAPNRLHYSHPNKTINTSDSKITLAYIYTSKSLVNLPQFNRVSYWKLTDPN